MMKPDWKDAPAGAKWLAMDESGDWYWFDIKPEIKRRLWMSIGNQQIAHAATDWKDSLEPRP